MRWVAAVVLLALAWPLAARAGEIRGKWGIGAGLFDNQTRQIALIHGHSNRVACAIDARFSQQETRDPGVGLEDHVDAELGPRLRVYTRPDADLSPYVDGWAMWLYGRDRAKAVGNLPSTWSEGVGGGIDLGVEYFTRWHCSVAIHSAVVSAEWRELHQKPTYYFPYLGGVGHSESLKLGLDPGLVLRAYW